MDTDEPFSGGLRPAEEAARVQPDLAADERERVLDEREAALDEREIRTAAHEAGISARIDEAEVVLAEAAARDAQAERRDAAAEERELAAALDAFLHPSADQYGAAIKARRASAIDRCEAQSDRLSSADDRSRLSGD